MIAVWEFKGGVVMSSADLSFKFFGFIKSRQKSENFNDFIGIFFSFEITDKILRLSVRG